MAYLNNRNEYVVVHSGEVYAYDKSAGGIAGYMNGGSVENCVNAGAVSSGNSKKGVICYNDGGAKVLNTIYTAAGETVTLQENLSNENILFAGIKGATPSGEKQYSYTMPADGNAEILESDLIYFQRDTSDGSWLIRSAADLQNLAAYVNGGNDYSGMTFKLARDINLESIENFTPIGNSSNKFSGTFDGNGRKISNLTINTDKDHAGLFGYVDSGAIKNLTLINANVTSSGRYAGALVGYSVSTGFQIENCNIISTVKSFTNTGGGLAGLLGLNDAVKNCVVISSVEGGNGIVGVSNNISTGNVLISDASENNFCDRYFALDVPTGVTVQLKNSGDETYTAFDGKTYYCAGTELQLVPGASYKKFTI